MNSARAPARLSRRRALGVLTAAAGLSLAGCVQEAQGDRRGRTPPIVIASGETQGVYYRYGAALAALLHAEMRSRAVDNVTTSGSIDNLRRLAWRQATVAFTAADAATDAYSGLAAFNAPVPLRAIASLYEDYMHLVVLADSKIHDITDLRRRRVSLGAPGSGTALLAERLLALAGVPAASITNFPLAVDESATALRSGRIDAFFWSGGLPTPEIADLAAQLPIRLLPLQGLSGAMHSTYSIAYRTATIERGFYPGLAPVTTLAVPDILVTTATADDQLVFDLTQLLFTARDRLARQVPEAAQLDPRAAIYTQPIPLHPAADRYYQSVKP